MDGVPAVYLLGALQPFQVEIRIVVCTIGVKTAFYTPWAQHHWKTHYNILIVVWHESMQLEHLGHGSTWRQPIGSGLPVLSRKVDIYGYYK